MTLGQTQRLPREFYERPTLEVAPDLIGKYLVTCVSDVRQAVRIVEVEAYVGVDDPACHAARGLTERTKPMFGPAGFTYVYLIYGMYNCLNVVTEPDGSPAAVLIRAAEPITGIEPMPGHNGSEKTEVSLLSGPGKLCRVLQVTTSHNSLDLTGETIYCEDRNGSPPTIIASRRIGIKVGTQRRWRFCDGNSRSLSRPASDRV